MLIGNSIKVQPRYMCQQTTWFDGGTCSWTVHELFMNSRKISWESDNLTEIWTKFTVFWTKLILNSLMNYYPTNQHIRNHANHSCFNNTTGSLSGYSKVQLWTMDFWKQCKCTAYRSVHHDEIATNNDVNIDAGQFTIKFTETNDKTAEAARKNYGL